MAGTYSSYFLDMSQQDIILWPRGCLRHWCSSNSKTMKFKGQCPVTVMNSECAYCIYYTTVLHYNGVDMLPNMVRIKLKTGE